ncbi:PQQ-like beta-propeller repeat protein [Natronomonas salina]|uniref:outer membrane protein assembly factor BamB family protein n=1 Tax=Natronomonas salina TaxID=1710540 RepID=UPI0015B55593|nr:PQQ-binding-like beta-propeller repeat protein [Natronomonas salina]QLD89614.1 PQQ-like beta-propeller repeat protein [Natronomonas salina]
MVYFTRRQFLATGGISGVFGGVLSKFGDASHNPVEAEGWRHPQATPGNTAATDDTGPQTTAEVQWQLQIDTAAQWRFSGLAHHEDTLFVPTHNRLLGVSTDGERRFVSEPGTERWLGPDEERTQIDSDPRVFGKWCFVASQAALYALDVTDGRPRWRYDVNSSIDAVVLLGNTLYLSALQGSEHALLAIGAKGGEQVWRRDGRLVPVAATPNVLVAATEQTGTLRGIDPATGDQLWRSELRVSAASLQAATVAVTDEMLWHVRGGVLTAADAGTGEPRWTFDLDGDGSDRGDRLAVADQTYVLEVDAERLSAIDPNGDRQWSRHLANPSRGIAVGGETIYVATQTGLAGIDSATGEQRFRVSPAPTGGDGVTPLVTDDSVYGVSGDTIYEVSEA